ncbi:MAG: SPFH/Band 7/PHB domain protein [Paludibacteraceae bacterium]|nr:SPFH/Band 7/PHB domain protein [Paludibacteraceae bacterium]
MGGGFIVLLVIIGLIVAYLTMAIKIIPQSETKIIERLGKFSKVLGPGMNFITPFLDAPRQIYARKVFQGARGEVYARNYTTDVIDLREQLYDFPKQNVITKDNVPVEINALLYFQIVDPVKATYEIDNLPNAIEKLTQTTLRNIIGELELDETLTSRDTINAKLRSVLDDATNKWGVKVNRVELQDITPPESVLSAMQKQMQAERNRRAEILRAEGEKQSAILESEGAKTAAINRAEAVKQTTILNAEGEAIAKLKQAEAEAAAIERIAEAIRGTNTDPATYQIAMKYIETLKDIASGQNNKTVYLPYEASSVLGSIGGIKDLFKKN